MTLLRDALTTGAKLLKESSTTPELDARVLLAHVLNCSTQELIIRSGEEIEESALTAFHKLIMNRADRYPIAYLTGEREFYGRGFRVTSDVLIPRPETELLVDHALESSSSFEGPLNVVDLGIGSGCIAISIALELTDRKRSFEIIATDVSTDALKIASENARRHSIGEKIKFVESNWFSAFDPAREKFQIIVSNPPYVAINSNDTSPEVSHEPAQALYSGESGMNDIEQILDQAHRFMKSGAILLCECGHDQYAATMRLFETKRLSQFYSIELLKDLAGKDRIIKLIRK